ncbi:hypothetical protein Lser_V15G27246 [Lactuca serriola]
MIGLASRFHRAQIIRTRNLQVLSLQDLTSSPLAGNIRSDDLRITSSIALIYKPYVLLS